MTAAIRMQGLRRRFGQVNAVDGIDLEIRQGEVVAFLGPNGAGKTTTLDMALGLGEPDAGSVEVMGMTPRQAVERGLISAVMQTGGLLKEITVKETLELVASFYAAPRPVAECLRRAGLDAIAGRRVGKCSGGEQQRLRFALSLLPDPAVLILDEPTAGMDATVRRAFWNDIAADARRGRTVVFATHYLEEAEMYAERIVLVRSGRIVADGTTAEVTASTTGRQVKATWPGAGAEDLDALRRLPGVTGTEQRGHQVRVTTDDSDAVARHLLVHTGATDLEIASRGLEDAFLALTSDQQTDALERAR